MFKVADKMASVCLWVGPAGSIPKRKDRAMECTYDSPGDGTAAKLRKLKM